MFHVSTSWQGAMLKKRIQVSKARLVTEEEENHQKEQDEFVEVSSTEPAATHQIEKDEQYSNILTLLTF